MKCLRCGYCCTHYLVTIVDDPEKGFDPMKDENLVVHQGDGPCKHLRGSKPGEYWCAIHGKPWYKHTPCAQFTQIGKPDDPCRMGKFVLEQERKKRGQDA